MSSPSRTSQFEKLHKILKKHYKPVVPDPNRPVLEHLLLACCLENAGYQAAEAALAALIHEFFDYNEVRVSTVRELSEVMSALPDPAAAAGRVKRVLQHVFEGSYAFSLEEVRKTNLGPAVERLGKIDGATPFCVAYVVQSTLGGHSIPVDSGTMEVLKIMDLVSEEDAASGTVPGLERAIPKSKGTEFGSLLHQLGADFTANPYSPAVHEILLAVNPEARERLPKRRAPKKALPAAPAVPGGDSAKAPQAPAPEAPGGAKEGSKRNEAEPKAARAKRKAVQEAPAAPGPSGEEGPAEAAAAKQAAGKDKGKEPQKDKDKPPAADGVPAEKGSAASSLSKKKPR